MASTEIPTAEELEPGRLKVLSYTDGNPPIGVNRVIPATQPVYVDAPVHFWEFHRVGKNTYRISVGGYKYVGVENGKVVASIFPEHAVDWEVAFHVRQRAFTIAYADRPYLGWTIPVDGGEHANIVIGPIIQAGDNFLPTQLFLLSRHFDDGNDDE